MIYNNEQWKLRFIGVRIMLSFSGTKRQGSLQDVGKSKLGSDDLIAQIEACHNFIKDGAELNPRQVIESGKLRSLVFRKALDPKNLTDTFEYWVKENGEATYYTIIISTKDRQIDSIRDESDYSVRSSALQFSEANELKIVHTDFARI